MKFHITQQPFGSRLYAILFVFGWLMSGSLQHIQAQTVNTSDSLALVNFYNTTAGSAWSANANWISGPVATWEGIGLDATGTRVTDLDLSNNNITGNLPNFNLPQLQNLSLAGNNISGQIPNFSTMPLLRVLDLSGNNLSGAIPNFANLSALLVLQLTGNSLTSLPNFTNLPNLQILSVENNQISVGSALPNLAACSQLQILELSGNNITGSIPAFNLLQLTVLRLADNQFSGTLPSFSGTPNLQLLVLTNNQLTGSIPNLDLTQLQELYLDYNDFSGTLPTFSNMPNLFALFLSGNNLSGTVPDFSGFANITILYLDDNAFTFAGMAVNVAHFNSIGGIMVYEPQAEIPTTVSSNTTLSVNAGGTPAGNTYTWYAAGGLSPVLIVNNDNSFTPGSSGAYYCAITNSQAPDLTIYSTPAALTVCGVSINITNSSCAGIDNGSLSAIPSGGTLPYTFAWSNGASTATISNLAAGTYTITVSSAGGCYSTASATVIDLSNPNFTLLQTAASFCNPQANSLTFPMIVQTSTLGTYSVTATTSLQSVTVNIGANTGFNLNLSSETAADENITFTVANASGCSKDTIIINDKCCRIMQEGALVVVGPIDKIICPPSPVTLQAGCVFKLVVTDNSGIVKAVLTPDNGQCIQPSTLVKHLTSLFATEGQYHIYGYKQCAAATPIVVGDVVDCPNPLLFYYKKAGLLVRLSTMNTILKSANLLPLAQPFTTSPWGYNGTESIASLADFNSSTVDWLLLELRDSLDNNIIVARKAALLLKNGTVVDVTAGGTMSSSAGVHFITYTPTDHHYLAVRHRNHLAVMSATQVPLDGFSNYNYTLGNNILGGLGQLYDTGGGLLSLRPGDIDANGVITVADYNYFAAQGALVNVYNDADANLDGNITVGDFNFWRVNAFAIGIPLIRY